MSHAFQAYESVNYSTEQCWVCGIFFAMPSTLQRKKAEDGSGFYCPNGHHLAYGKSRVQVLEERLAEQMRVSTRETERAVRAEKSLSKITKRINNGVCPCCQRTFKQLARHMKCKHPGYKP